LRHVLTQSLVLLIRNHFIMKHLLEIIKLLNVHKTYVYYSLAYGLSTLIVPLGVQFLVNNLALSGLWLNISAFIIFIVIGVIVSQVIKHSQHILVESLQREIYCIEMENWKDFKREGFSHYYFEVLNLLKSFSKSYSNLIELALIIIFGLSTIMMFHPMFIPISIIIVLTIVQIYKTSSSALESSMRESDQKYKIFDIIQSKNQIQDNDLKSFLQARDNHFNFIRKKSFKISALVVIVQGLLLSVGCYLVKINQLSVGQLVSAEIIIAGIFIPLSKLPLTLEAVYDYETSKYKIAKAMGGSDE
jgi:ABC-type protease/lipase transport system fused ATPase/permease subunit